MDENNKRKLIMAVIVSSVISLAGLIFILISWFRDFESNVPAIIGLGCVVVSNLMLFVMDRKLRK